MAKAKITNEDIFKQINLSVDREGLEAIADAVDIEYDENTTDDALALAVVTKVDAMDDAGWEALDETVQSFVNDCNEQKKEIIKTASTAKPPKASKAKPAKAAAPAPAASPAEEAGVTLADVEACKTKKALAELVGSKVELKAKSLKAQKNEAIKALGLKGAAKPKADKPAKPAKADKTPKAAPPKPVKADATAAQPTKAELDRIKAQAKETAEMSGKMKESLRKFKVEWRPGSNSQVILEIVRNSPKAGKTFDEVVAALTKKVEAGDCTCSNPKGRCQTMLMEMVRRGHVEIRDEKYFPLTGV